MTSSLDKERQPNRAQRRKMLGIHAVAHALLTWYDSWPDSGRGVPTGEENGIYMHLRPTYSGKLAHKGALPLKQLKATTWTNF